MALARTLPSSWYTEPWVFEQERRAIFAREWLYVAHLDQLRERGAYVAADVCGWPIVVVALDGAGTVAGYHNVCLHRGGPLVWDGTGRGGNSFVCRYHGWAYDLEGGLRAASDFGDGIAAGDISLASLRVETWRGCVFVNLAGASAPALVDSLGAFADASASSPLESFRVIREVDESIEANWKTYADNYLEGYHLPLVHPGLSRQVDPKRYEVDANDGWVEHRVPSADGAPTVGRWLWRFPNLALNLYPDGMTIERFTPIGAGRTRIQYACCFAPDADPNRAEASIGLSMELLAEDRQICEAVQRNLAAGVYDTGPLSPRHEAGVAAFQAMVRTAVEGIVEGAVDAPAPVPADIL